MSEFINEAPTVLDDSQLPTRFEDSCDVLNSHVSKITLARKKQLQTFGTANSQAIQDLELLDRLISITSPPDSKVPDLTSDIDTLDSESIKDSAEAADPVDSQEIYDLIAHISDPEHPLSLGQLAVVNLPDIEVFDDGNPGTIAEVLVKITPTIAHCSLATLIGLGIRVRLERSLMPRYRVTILLKEGSHQSENQVNKQLNDKERVAAACENEQLVEVVSKMLSTCR
ncbi:HCL421Wp [Eremothecium sinecaudum]|uniref:HCL421Wp n=1 Tax=Eremothecium sinecaudum TaxID=45286 RepID=A0A109UYB3_9SACH|nr:HCL421Wp [Eremothecium sinecaudum]AMD19730.1 HCL421Wp [Eremothecium sinecaudum]